MLLPFGAGHIIAGLLDFLGNPLGLEPLPLRLDSWIVPCTDRRLAGHRLHHRPHKPSGRLSGLDFCDGGLQQPQVVDESGQLRRSRHGPGHEVCVACHEATVDPFADPWIVERE